MTADVDYSSLPTDLQAKSVGLRVGSHLTLSLHSSNEPGELSQWLCHDDSNVNIGISISIIISIILFGNDMRANKYLPKSATFDNHQIQA